MKTLLPVLLVVGLGACRPNRAATSTREFEALMHRLAEAWTTQNTDAALACFTDDATYTQPPDQQFYQGRAQLKAYFGALKKGTTMRFHHLWFDETTQSGAGEFTFGSTTTRQGVTGVVVVSLHDGRIKTWREYFVKGPLDFDEFIATEGKNWKWHIGNYP